MLEVGVGVEQPIARRRPEDLDLGDLVVVHAQARAEHVRIRLVRDDHLGERLARGRIEQTAVMVDLHRLVDDTALDVGGRRVLVVADAVGERQSGGIALRLRGDVEVDRPLQPAAHAGNLCRADRRDEQRA